MRSGSPPALTATATALGGLLAAFAGSMDEVDF